MDFSTSLMSNSPPWDIDNLLPYLHYCCPECDYKSQEDVFFRDHMTANHRTKSTDASQDDFSVDVKKEYDADVSEIETTPIPVSTRNGELDDSETDHGVSNYVTARLKELKEKMALQAMKRENPGAFDGGKHDLGSNISPPHMPPVECELGDYITTEDPYDEDGDYVPEDKYVVDEEDEDYEDEDYRPLKIPKSSKSGRRRGRPPGSKSKDKIKHKEEIDWDDGDEELEDSKDNVVKRRKSENPTNIPLQPKERQVKRFPCDHCPGVFTAYVKLIKHKKAIHLIEIEDTELTKFKCPQCPDTGFATEKKLKNHVQAVHETSYTCDQCGKSMASRFSLNTHVDVVHKKIKRFTCDQCGAMFARNIQLSRHVLSHHTDQQQKWPCKECDKVYNTHVSLNAHITEIHRNDPLPCEHCGRYFKRANILKKHIKIVHENVRPHRCAICAKSFSSIFNAKLHLIKNHGKSKGDNFEPFLLNDNDATT